MIPVSYTHLTFKNASGKTILMKMVKGIQENKAYLGEVDGLIGDGDHGMNMNKGFTVFENRFSDKEFSFTEGLDELGTILLNEIGGSMGPIYGTILMDIDVYKRQEEDALLKNGKKIQHITMERLVIIYWVEL